MNFYFAALGRGTASCRHKPARRGAAVANRNRNAHRAFCSKSTDLFDEWGDDKIRVLRDVQPHSLGRDQAFVANLDFKSRLPAGHDQRHDGRVFHHHVWNRHLRFKHRLQHHPVRVLNLNGHHRPLIRHRLPRDERLRRVRDAWHDGDRSTEAGMFVRAHFQRVAALVNVRQQNFARDPGPALRDHVAGDDIAHPHRGIRHLRRFRHEISVFITDRHPQITHRLGERAELKRHAHTRVRAGQNKVAVVARQRKIRRRVQRQGHRGFLSRQERSHVRRAEERDPRHRGQCHSQIAARRTAVVGNLKRDDGLRVSQNPARKERRARRQLRTQRYDRRSPRHIQRHAFRRHDVDLERRVRLLRDRRRDRVIQQPRAHRAQLIREAQLHVHSG